MTTATTYKTTRTTRVERSQTGSSGRVAPPVKPVTLSVAVPAPGVLQIQGVSPAVLVDRLPHILRLLLR